MVHAPYRFTDVADIIVPDHSLCIVVEYEYVDHDTIFARLNFDVITVDYDASAAEDGDLDSALQSGYTSTCSSDGCSAGCLSDNDSIDSMIVEHSDTDGTDDICKYVSYQHDPSLPYHCDTTTDSEESDSYKESKRRRRR